MGPDAFHRLARAYVSESPSHTPNARWFSHKLPDFIAATAPWKDQGELADLARLERAIADAFDAPDEATATLDGLRELAVEDWATLTFRPHASAARLDLSTNAFEIWTALKGGTEPPEPLHPPETERLIVWREGLASKVRLLGPEEAMLWDEATRSVPFGALCELAAVFDDPGEASLRVARYLAGWLGAGLLAADQGSQAGPRDGQRA
jgi:hypothetical protein